ncbi:MAG: hypothetical protein ACTSO7_18580 [Candidatus Heimdallarchaeota archaeon]
MEISPFYREPQDEPTEEDDQLDISISGEKEFRKTIRNELITTIFLSLGLAAIGIVIFFMGNENSGDKLWVGYVLLGIFCSLSLFGIVVSIIRYLKRLNKTKTKNDDLKDK